MGTTQSAVAGLESDRSSPRVATLERALRACGQQLTLASSQPKSSVDETMVFENLKLTPEQRLRAFQASYDNVREFALAARRSIGGVA
jgi:transcriptional regulator with XRE-family HTH domain